MDQASWYHRSGAGFKPDSIGKQQPLLNNCKWSSKQKQFFTIFYSGLEKVTLIYAGTSIAKSSKNA